MDPDRRIVIPRLVTGIGLVLFVWGPDVAAQAVSVRVVEEGSRRPVAGALASLRIDPSRPLTQALTDPFGRAVLTAPGPGQFLVRLDRIGYLGVTVGPVAVAPSDTVPIEIVAPADRVALPDLVVTSRDRPICRLEEGAGLVAMVWAEARKALASAELSRQRLPLMEVTRFERGYAPGSAIVEEKVSRYRTDSVTPFVAADPGRLARSGYVERTGGITTFFAPDALVLLSDEFLAHHCFRLVDPPNGGSLIGLGFEPAPDRGRADVTGTLWLDRRTAELRYLEFEYANLAKEHRTGNEGGRVDYVRFPDGRWVVGKWRARVAWHERGGEVALVGPDGSAALGAVITGTVFDSSSGRLLAGAVVSAAGGAYVDTTGESGEYRLEIPTEGDFAISVDHPLLRLLDLPGTIRSSAVIRGQEIRADFAVPSRETLIRRACPGRPIHPPEGALLGRLTDSTGRARPGEVEVAWDGGTVLRAGHRISIGETGYRYVVSSDLEGRFKACGVPSDVELRIGPVAGRSDSQYRTRVRSGELAVAALTLP